MRSHGDHIPARYVASGTWPHANLTPDAPVSAHYGQALARRLTDAMRAIPISSRALATLAGLSQPTVTRILHGQTLPDLGTLARLAAALGAEVYPAGLHTELTLPPPPPGPT